MVRRGPDPKLPRWSVPREWEGQRCFILGGGASLKDQYDLIPQLRGRIIAIKQTVYLRPRADVMFVSGRDDAQVCAPYFAKYKGPRIVCRSAYPGMPKGTLYLRRSVKGRYSRDPHLIGGLDAGTSAINLAALFGAAEIIILGMDMTGGRWVKRHHLPVIPQWHFDLHLANLETFVPELERDRIRVVNCSPISAIPWFEFGRLEDFV
jgi:hypothetical protein